MRLLSLLLAVFVVGCAESIPLEGLAEEGPSFKTQQASLRACSEGLLRDRCPSGQHIAWVTSDYGCPSRYAYYCEADTHSFQACGLGCPYGYHSTRYDWTLSCYQRGGVEPNITTCERNDWPRAFHMCGAGCPAGWHDEAYDSDLDCFTSTHVSMSANATSCAANDGPAFTLCKISWSSSCPGGYDKITEYHDPSCNIFGPTSSDTMNVISCARRPPKLSSVKLDLGTVHGGAALTGRIFLDGKAEELGATVTLMSNDPDVQVQSKVTVPYRADDVSFPIQTSIVKARKSVTITAMFDGRQAEWTLTLKPLPTVSSVSVDTFSSDNPPATIQGLVYLDDEAQGSTSVTLSSSDFGVASVPTTVIVPDGKRGATFTVTLYPVNVDTPVTLTARIDADDVPRSTTLTVPVPPVIPPGPLGQAIFQDEGCNAYSLPATDNGSTGSVNLPFSINFHGAVYDHVFINNNGNVTFEAPHDWTFAWDVALGGYYEPVESTIAAFYADVDTRGAGSNVVHYGEVSFGGHPAFCVNWLNVGYFNSHSDKLNSFQVLLVQRNDVGLGDFDIYLNYGSVQWDCIDDNIYCAWGGTTVTAGYWAVPVHGFTGFRYSYRLPGAWTRGTWLDDSGSPYSLIHSSHNSLLPGRYIFPIRNGRPATLGTLSGRVTDTASTLMAKAPVQVCPVPEGLCTVVTTDGAQGTYSVEGLSEGDYTITAFPSFRSSAMPHIEGPVHVTAGVTLTVNVTLPPAMSKPPDVSLSPSTAGGNGVSIVNFHDSLDLSVPGCAGGTASYSVRSATATVLASGSMLEAPAGTYSARIPPLYPNKGFARVSVNIACPSSGPQSVAFDLYIDPSGAVRTLQGRPVRDALVTLYRSDKPEGPFTEVPSGSAIMSPLNRTNPDVTDTQGRFRWDVIAGYYKVRVEREGCLSPSGAPYVESEVLPVPPPVTDLELRLNCPALDDLTSPSSSASVSPPPNAHGWNNTEVQVALTAIDDDSGVDALVFTLSGAQPGGLIMNRPEAEVLIATEGETTMSWFARDVAGNPEEAHSFQIRIDQTPPSSSALPSPLANAHGWNSTPVTVHLEATDLGSGIENLVYTLTGAQSGGATVSGSSASVTIFAEGTTTLTWYSRDLAGNQEPPRSLEIRIDMTAPVLSCAASPAVLSPPNHMLIPVQVNARLDDAGTGSGGSVILSSVMSNEPDDGLGDGDTSGDIQGWVPGTADTHGLLRAERLGSGSGRTYTLIYQGSDLAGNLATCVTTVAVLRGSSVPITPP